MIGRAHSSPVPRKPEILGLALSHLLLRTLPPDGAALTMAVHDTLFKRYGKKVFGVVWQHDGAAKGRIRSGAGRVSWCSA